MADRKISDLTALTTPASGDYLPIVDISEAAAASKNKRVTVQSLFQGIPVNVGIGTSSPSGKLNILQDSTANTTPAIRITGSAGDPTNYFLDVVPIFNGSTVDYRWDLKSISTNTALLYLSGAGRVGIGTSSPQHALQVKSGSFSGTLSLSGGSELTGGESSILMGNNDSVGTAGPCVIKSSNRNLMFGVGNSFTASSGGAFTEYLRIDGSGRLLVGTSTARNNFFNLGVYTAKHLVEGTGGTGAGRGSLAIVNNSTAATDPGYLVFGRTKGSTAGSNTVLAADDWVGMISFQGSDGTEFVECAQINAYIDGAPGANDMPGRLVFSTTADGASSPTERMRIDSSGRVGIGTSSPTTLLDVNADTVRVRTARTPASATATGDAGEICWDANYIYVCTATNTWKRAALSTW